MTIHEILLEQLSRILDATDAGSLDDAIAQAGFLDVLRSEEEGGAGLSLEQFLPLVLELGRRGAGKPIAERMVARYLDPASAPEAIGAVLSTARPLAAAVTAGLMAGAIERLFELTLDYVQTRKQFGRSIGQFQAVQQQMAVFAEEMVAARMAAGIAFRGVPYRIEPRSAAIAKIRVGEASVVAIATAHGLHGAIGISDEYALGGLARSLRLWRSAHGHDEYWAGRLGMAIIESDVDMVSIVTDISHADGRLA
ncbi:MULTISPECIES: acyl-CoA dehydrogenase family protein [unclassified Sphingomonas]|uniref:acyl-CoA dehydrogenase family protein n=1 Tax=unclassified Sphingomonas TaxID=196159 RepID=UPI0006F3A63E|nr:MULTISPECIES: acyl-CoA dehydrogenase family protein [unclassified Sphingomonas]KQX18591.1 hypothetical protein ASD17_15725 [Sphingomonas sp. Root1294]KQY72085.1 hypothetical protein ASD39_19250 [Sphingomonas sp. Root50]KRB94645.1 hypothetical protein ASE22_01505 [Sphingomonas sp. Root720]